MENFFLITAAVAFLAFAWRRLMRYLHMLQQDDYNNTRFIQWLIKNRVFDKQVSATLLVMGAFMYLLGSSFRGTPYSFVVTAIFASFFFFEPDPRKGAKKPLVLTQRAMRILGAALLICAMCALVIADRNCMLMWLAMVQLLPIILVAGNLALAPVEAKIQKKFMDEASDRLKKVSPTVIGITGSFGKTSVKHILGHVLELNAPTLFTPGSINTLMGISRIVREQMRDDCKYFIVEMGAYGQGSIERLCKLTPPSVGIITAIGDAHYERFKTLDTVARAKFELAEAVVQNQPARLIVHEDVLAQNYAKQFVDAHRGNFIVCGQGESADLKINNVEQTKTGLNVKIVWQGREVDLFAPLFGVHHAENVALAFATAVALGVPVDRAALALKSVPQITHRLEVKPQADGTIYIDDAYNSNPKGFMSALGLMDIFASSNGARRILITPGVTELGPRHAETHRTLGAEAAKHADVAIAVNADRIPTFVEGFSSSGGKQIISVSGLPDAQKWISENAKPGDIILFENDLPDVFERKLSL